MTNRISTSLKKGESKTPKAGISPPAAPHMMALFPAFLPRKTYPIASPNTVCATKSKIFTFIKSMLFIYS